MRILSLLIVSILLSIEVHSAVEKMPYSLALSNRFPGLSATAPLQTGYVNMDVRFDNDVLPKFSYGRNDNRFKLELGSQLNKTFDNRLLESSFFRESTATAKMSITPLDLSFFFSEDLSQLDFTFNNTIGIGFQKFQQTNIIERDAISISLKKEFPFNSYKSSRWYSPMRYFNNLSMEAHYYLFNTGFPDVEKKSSSGHHFRLKMPLPMTSDFFQHAASAHFVNFESDLDQTVVPDADYFLFQYHKQLFNAQFESINYTTYGYNAQLVYDKIRMFGGVRQTSGLDMHYLNAGIEYRISQFVGTTAKIYYTSEDEMLVYIGLFSSFNDISQLPSHLNRMFHFVFPQF